MQKLFYKYCRKINFKTRTIVKYTEEQIRNFCLQHSDKKKLAAVIGLSEYQTRKLLQKMGIESDGRKQANQKRTVPVPSKEELIELYTNQSLTFVEIAKIYNTSNVTVKKWFVNYNIQLLTHSEVITQKVVPKIIKSNLKNYGYEHFFATEEGKKKVADSFIKKYGVPFHPINNTSDAELEVLSYFNSLREGFKKAHIHGIELDGYNEELKIAFEYCGLFWHKEKIKGKNLHFKKYKICTENGIRLITIFEDEWKNKNIQTKGFISSVLRANNHKLYARKLKIEKVDKRHYDTIDFIKQNHIQGSPQITNTICHYILTDDTNNIYASMSFSKHHRNGNEIVLSRYCVKIDHDIVGGAQKLFTNALNDFKCDIKSWSDNRWSLGKIYEKLGFTLTKKLPKDYSYVGNKQRIPKQKMTKKKMKAAPDQSEYERACELGFDRIWDCGKKTWVYFYK